MTRRRRHRRSLRPAGAHARCPVCGGEYGEVDGCAPDARPTVYVWGAEPWWHDEWAEMFDEPMDPAERCVDCNAALGFPHHDTCDKAYCWSCDDQALICAHSVPEDER